LIMPKNVLDHLLKVEAEAAALVTDAQNEADRRIHDNEEKNRAVFEERLKEETHKQETSLKKEKEEINARYQTALDNFHEEIKSVNACEPRFCALLNEYLAERTAVSRRN